MKPCQSVRTVEDRRKLAYDYQRHVFLRTIIISALTMQVFEANSTRWPQKQAQLKTDAADGYFGTSMTGSLIEHVGGSAEGDTQHLHSMSNSSCSMALSIPDPVKRCKDTIHGSRGRGLFQ